MTNPSVAFLIPRLRRSLLRTMVPKVIAMTVDEMVSEWERKARTQTGTHEGRDKHAGHCVDDTVVQKTHRRDPSSEDDIEKEVESELCSCINTGHNLSDCESSCH